MAVAARATLTAASAAFVAALVGFGGTVALVVQAGQAVGGTPVQIISAVTALCIGIAIAGAGLSIAFRIPIVLAWSTPGAALIAAGALGASWEEALGAYVVSALLMVLLGLVPALGQLAERIPASIASAMLAGVLAPFCLNLFRTLEADFAFTAAVLAVFVVSRHRAPLYAMLIVLAVAITILLGRGDIPASTQSSFFGTLSAAKPDFDPVVVISLGLPLFLVTLASQNLPGLLVLRSAGYAPPVQPILLTTGVAQLVLAPFGAHGVNLAAITAAICTSDDAHPDMSRRWLVGVLYAALYAGLALFSAPLVALFLAMPPSAIATVAGIALLSPLTAAIGGMLATPADREASVLAFAATASGVSLLGIGSAFWGLLIGFMAIAARLVLAPKGG